MDSSRVVYSALLYQNRVSKRKKKRTTFDDAQNAHFFSPQRLGLWCVGYSLLLVNLVCRIFRSYDNKLSPIFRVISRSTAPLKKEKKYFFSFAILLDTIVLEIYCKLGNMTSEQIPISFNWKAFHIFFCKKGQVWTTT